MGLVKLGNTPTKRRSRKYRITSKIRMARNGFPMICQSRPKIRNLIITGSTPVTM
jgi:hypothetical protein